MADGPYDAIASIGMAEHVGLTQLGEYAAQLHALLAPEGRLLNHAISRRPGPPGDPKGDKTSFIDRYVFPDGELHPLSTMVDVLESAGFEVRDVESLREHYADTLRAWVGNLEHGWDQAVRLSSAGRARVWRLYMAGSALGFESNRLGVNQVLAVKPGPGGASGLPGPGPRCSAHACLPEQGGPAGPGREQDAGPGPARALDGPDRTQRGGESSEPADVTSGVLRDVRDVEAVRPPSGGGEGVQPVGGPVEETVRADLVPACGVGDRDAHLGQPLPQVSFVGRPRLPPRLQDLVGREGAAELEKLARAAAIASSGGSGTSETGSTPSAP